MKTAYFNTKTEMTAFAATRPGETYRTRLACGCRGGFNHRDGILVLIGEKVTWKLVRCKACRKEAGDGTV